MGIRGTTTTTTGTTTGAGASVRWSNPCEEKTEGPALELVPFLWVVAQWQSDGLQNRIREFESLLTHCAILRSCSCLDGRLCVIKTPTVSRVSFFRFFTPSDALEARLRRELWYRAPSLLLRRSDSWCELDGSLVKRGALPVGFRVAYVPLVLTSGSESRQS